MKFFISIFLTLISIFSFGQTSKDSIQFSITFSSCFENDLVGLSINKVKLFDNVKITTTDRILDISNVDIYQNGGALWLTINKKTKQLKEILISDSLYFDISFNKKLQKFKIDLKNGNNIFIDNCDSKVGGVVGGLSVKQFKGKVYLY